MRKCIVGTDFTQTVERAVVTLTFERAGKGAVLTLERFLAAVNARVTRHVARVRRDVRAVSTLQFTTSGAAVSDGGHLRR